MHPQAREVRDAFVAVRQSGEVGGVLERYYAEDLRATCQRRGGRNRRCEAG